MRTPKEDPSITEVLENMKLKFASGNGIPVERTSITAVEMRVIAKELAICWSRERGAKAALAQEWEL